GRPRPPPCRGARPPPPRPPPPAPRGAPPPLLEPQLADDDERLHDDPPRHLRLADPPIPERDRDLDDPCAGAARPMRHLDLEHVAAGVDAVERDGLEGGSAPGLESAGEVPWSEAEDRPGEEAAAAADDPATEAPVEHGTAARVARADDEVRRAVPDGPDEGRERRGIVRPV